VVVSATLYRCRLPTDRLCRCGTVARALRAAHVDADEVRVAWRAAGRDEVDALTGQRRVPVLVLGREVVCDSRRILQHLAWRRETAA
jgi:glutathione S-transferase